MTTRQGRGSGGPLAELEAFLGFLRTLWGLLAGVSVFFPLSNLLLGAIPLAAYDAGGVYDRVSPALVSALATVVALFVVLATYGRRRHVGEPDGRTRTARAAWRSLAASLACLAAYVAVHQVYAEWAWGRWQWGSGDPRKLLVELPLAAAYVASFALLTRAFVLLAMLEYYGEEADARR